MEWYDVFSFIYDRVISKTYLPYRQVAIEALRLRPDLTVLGKGSNRGDF